MNNDQQSSEYVPRPDAANPDMARPAATSDDYISIKEARAIFTSKGRSITERTLQRYCEKHYLDGQKRVTAEGEKWFILKSSVLTRIAELDEFDKLRPAATSDDVSSAVVEQKSYDLFADNGRQVTTEEMSEAVVHVEESHATTSVKSRHVAASRDNDDNRETSSRFDEETLSARERELLAKEIDHLKRESDLKQIIIQRYEIENGGLREDKEKLYALLDSANQEKRMLIEGDRDSKDVMKNNNKLIAFLSQFFKGKEEIAAPTTDGIYRSSNIRDMLAGDERSN